MSMALATSSSSQARSPLSSEDVEEEEEEDKQVAVAASSSLVHDDAIEVESSRSFLMALQVSYKIFLFWVCVCVFGAQILVVSLVIIALCSAFDSFFSFMQFQDCSDFWEEFQSSCKCAPDGSLTFYLSLLHAGASESAATVLFNSRVL